MSFSSYMKKQNKSSSSGEKNTSEQRASSVSTSGGGNFANYMKKQAGERASVQRTYNKNMYDPKGMWSDLDKKYSKGDYAAAVNAYQGSGSGSSGSGISSTMSASKKKEAADARKRALPLNQYVSNDITVALEPYNTTNDTGKRDPEADKSIEKSFKTGKNPVSRNANTFSLTPVNAPEWVENSDWYKNTTAEDRANNTNENIYKKSRDLAATLQGYDVSGHNLNNWEESVIKNMTPDEQKEFSYRLGKYGEDAAYSYVRLKADEVNNRAAAELVKSYDSEENPAMKAAKAAAIAGKSGLGSFWSGTTDKFTAMIKGDDTPIPESVSNRAYSMLRNKEGIEGMTPAGVALDVVQNSAMMLPTLAATLGAGMAMAPAAAAAPALGAANTSAASAVMAKLAQDAPQIFGIGATMAPMSAGQTYSEDIASGVPVDKARLHAFLEAANQAGGEYLLGGFEDLTGGFTKQWAEKALGNIASTAGSDTTATVARALSHFLSTPEGRYAFSMGSEAFEEIVQGTVSHALNNAMFGKNEGPIDQEDLYSGLVAALSAGIGNVPSYVSGTARGLSIENYSADQLRNAANLLSENRMDYADENGVVNEDAYEAAMEQRDALISQADYVDQGGKLTPLEKSDAEGIVRYGDLVKEVEAVTSAAMDSQVEGSMEEESTLNVKGFGPEGNKVISEIANKYSDSGEKTYGDILTSANALYNAGRSNAELTAEQKGQIADALTEDEFRSIYEAGARDRNAFINIEEANRISKIAEKYRSKDVKEGSVKFVGIDEAEIRKKDPVKYAQAKTVANVVSKVLGINVELFRSNEVGFETEDGSAALKYEGENGSYDSLTNTLRLDINADLSDSSDSASKRVKGMSYINVTASHEITHWMEKYAPAVYQKLSDAIVQNLSNDEGYMNGRQWSDVISDEMKRLSKHGHKATESDAMHEIVARACEDMLSGTGTMRTLIEESLSESEKKSVYSHIRNIFNSIKEFLKEMLGVTSKRSEAAALRRMSEEVDAAIKSLWLEGVAEGRAYTAAIQTETKEALKEQYGIDISDAGTVSREFSERSWSNTDKKELLSKLVAAGYDEKAARKWIRDVSGIAFMIAADRSRLDYKAAENQTMLKFNQEYYRTLDTSTLCAKRILYQGTYDAIQKALPNTPLLSNDVIRIRQILNEEGEESPCGICYVESRRRHLGRFAKRWLDSYEGEYKPQIADVTSTEGLEALRLDHPDTYEDFVAAMRKKGTANPKVVELRTDYRGEINNLSKSIIEKITRIGGLRVQSFSDFEVVHTIDMMQAVLDMSHMGLTAQAYTKVPAFAAIFGDTGIKINLSLIGDVDENGKLIFDDKEGINHNEAFKLRKKYTKNVGTILVGRNDAHILAAMADPRIDFIIPFHRSGWGKAQFRELGLTNYTDYQKSQNERNLDGSSIKAGNLYPVDYWDYDLTGKENAERYLEICKEEKRIPKFSQFLTNNHDGSWSLKEDGSTDGYWKLLIDFKMYDNDGVGAPQEKVTGRFNMVEARKALDAYEGGANTLPVAQKAVDRFVEEYKEKHNRIQYSDRMYADESVTPIDTYSDNNKHLSKDGTPYFSVGYITRIYKPYYGIKPLNSTTENRTSYFSKDDMKAVDEAWRVYEDGIISGVDKTKAMTSAGMHAFNALLLRNGIDQKDRKGLSVKVDGVSIKGGDYYVYIHSHIANSVAYNIVKEQDRIAVIFKLDDVIKNAKYVGSSEYTKQNKNILRRDYFESVIKYDGTRVVSFSVDVFGNRNKYASHIVTKIDLDSIKVGDPSLNPGAPDTLGLNSSISNDLRKSIPAEIIKTNDVRYFDALSSGDRFHTESIIRQAAKNAGMATDEGGRKLIDLYHGTPSFGFTDFNMNSNTNSKGMIYATTKREVSANYAGRDNYAVVREIGKGFVKNASTIEDVIHNAENVYGAKYEKLSEKVKSEIISKSEDKAREIADKLDDMFDLQREVFPILSEDTDEAMEFANKLSCCTDIFYTTAYQADNFDEDEGRYIDTYSDSYETCVIWFEKYLPEIRDYIRERYDEIKGTESQKLADFYLGYEMSDAEIDLKYNFAPIVKGDGNLLVRFVKGDPHVSSMESLKESTEKTHKIGSYHLYGNLGSKPLVIDCGGSDWLSIRYEKDGKIHSTDFIARDAKDDGYTSVVFKNIVDGGETADDYIFFNANQVKSADPITYDDNGNIIPPSKRFDYSKNDIRFSDRDDNITGYAPQTIGTIDQLEQYNESLRAMSQSFEETLESAGAQKSKLSDAQIHRIALKLIKEYGSKADVKEIEGSLKSMYNYMDSTAKASARQLVGFAKGYAEKILSSAETKDTRLREQYPDLGKKLKDIRIRISPTIQNEMAYRYDSYNNFRKSVFGLLDLSTKEGIEVDSIYEDLSNQYPNLFPEEVTNDSDRMLRIVEVARELKGKTVKTNFGSDFDDVAYTLGQEMLAQYFAEKGDSKHQRNIDLIKSEMEARHRDEIGKLRKAQMDQIEKLKAKVKQGNSYKAMREEIERLKNDPEYTWAKLNAHYEELNKRAALRKFTSEARQRLIREARRLRNMKGGPEFEKQKAALLGDLDLVSIGLRKNTKDSLERTLKEAEKHAAIDPDYAKSAEYTRLKEVISGRLDGSHISDMSVDEIVSLTESMVNLKYMQQAYNRMLKNDLGSTVAEYGRRGVAQQNNVVGSMRTGKGVAGLRADLMNALSNYALYMENPTRAAEMLDGYQKRGVFTELFTALNDGQTKAAKFRMESSKMFEEVLKDKELVNTFADQNIPLYDIVGQYVYISKGMRIALYLHSLNTQNMGHIETTGINIPDAALYKKGRYTDAYNLGTIIPLTQSKIQAIIGGMTEAEKKFADVAYRFFNENSKNAINETSMVLKGYEIAVVKQYFPIKTDKNFTKADVEGITRDASIEGSGIFKERNSYAVNPVLLEDVAQVLSRQIDTVSKYYGLAIPVRDLNKVWNYTSTGYAASMKSAVAMAWGEKGKKYIENVISDIQANRQGDTGTDVLGMLKGLYAGSVLTVNPSVAVKQFSSYPFAAAYIDPDCLVKGMAGKTDYEYMDSITPWSYMRRQGMSGTEMGEVYKQNGLINKASAPKEFTKKYFNWIQTVDVYTTNRLFNACEEQVKKDHPKLEVRGSEYNKKVAELYNKVLQNTQPSYDVMQRNEFLKSTDNLMKTLTAFKTQTFNMGGELIDAVAKARSLKALEKDGNATKAEVAEANKKMIRTIASTVASQAMLCALSAAAAALLHKMRPYKDEEGKVTAESVFKKWASDFLKSFSGMMFLGSELQAIVLGISGKEDWYEIKAPAFEGVNDYVSSASKAWDAGKKFFMDPSSGNTSKFMRQIADVSMKGATVFGIPANNLYNIYNAFYLWSTDAKNRELLTFEAGKGLLGITDTTSADSVYYDRLFNSLYKRNDWNEFVKEYNRMKTKNGPDKVNSALVDRLKDTEEIKAAGEARYTHDAKAEKEAKARLGSWAAQGSAMAPIVERAVYSVANNLKNADKDTSKEEPVSEEWNGSDSLSGYQSSALSGWVEMGGSTEDFYDIQQKILTAKSDYSKTEDRQRSAKKALSESGMTSSQQKYLWEKVGGWSLKSF